MQELTPGSSDPMVELSAASLATLRSAVAAAGGPADDARKLRAVVSTLAHEARARGVTPERLLVYFKSVWQVESAARYPSDRRSATELFDEMVSLCIREYFA